MIPWKQVVRTVVVLLLVVCFPSGARAALFEFNAATMSGTGVAAYITTDITLTYVVADYTATRCSLTGNDGWSKTLTFNPDGNGGDSRRDTIRVPGVTKTTAYTFECFDANSISLFKKSTTLTVVPKILPETDVVLQASTLSLPVGGGEVEFTWTIVGATVCEIQGRNRNGDFLKESIPPTSGSRVLMLTEPNSYITVSCNNQDGLQQLAAYGLTGVTGFSDSDNKTVTVDNGNPSIPGISMQITPGGIDPPGGEVTILWQVYDNGVYPPSTCQATDWLDNGSATLNRDGSVDGNGMHRSTPQNVTAPRTFSMECTNKYGTSRASVEILFRDSGGNFPPPQIDPRKCGNGTIDPGEACDKGTASNGFCPAECSSTCAKNNCGGPTPPPLPVGPPAPPLPPGPPAPPTGDGLCQAPNVCVSGGCAPDKYKPGNGTCSDNRASCCTPLALPSPGVGYFNPLKYNSVDSVLTAVLSTLQSIVVTLSIIMIIVGAVMYILSAGNESRVTQAKVAITAAMVGLALAIAAPAFLKEIGELLGWIEVTQVVDEAQSFTQIATKVLNFLLSIVGIIGIIMLVIGGLMYLTAGGDEGKAETGKKITTYAIIAIAIALSALVLVTQVAKFFG